VLGLVVTRAILGEAAVVARVTTTFEAGGVSPFWLYAWLPGQLLAPGQPHWDTFREVDADVHVRRPELVAELAALLRPRESKQYVLVVGESGAGKSTAVRNAARSLPWPVGCVYFSAPELVSSFSTDLALALGFFRPFEPLASLYDWWGGQRAAGGHAGQSDEPDATWAAVRDVLLKAAAAFRAKHGRPAVLIIDAADYVAKKRPSFFGDPGLCQGVCGRGRAADRHCLERGRRSPADARVVSMVAPSEATLRGARHRGRRRA
jgi:hypothetical protein